MTTDWRQALSRLHGATQPDLHAGGWWIDAPSIDVQALASLMQSLGFRLSTLTGVARPDDETEVFYHYCLGSEAVNIRVCTRDNGLPSITPITRSAGWAEREIHDLYGVEFAGHPDPARLLRPAEFEPGMFRG